MLADFITIVSGLPRSGTSLMMQMLQAGGMSLIMDDKREADIHNPRGYFEFERVKTLEADNTWMDISHGKCIKILFHLLKYLPPQFYYKVLFMDRDLNEVIKSQDKVLKEKYSIGSRTDKSLKEMFENELINVHKWLKGQENISYLIIDYKDIIETPLQEAIKIESFLDLPLNKQQMTKVVDPSLYRNKLFL